MLPQEELQTLLQRLDAIAATGIQPDGSRFRPVYSAAENEAYSLLEGWMRASGLATRYDAAGNLMGRLEGQDPTAPVIATGSHLDSVQNGGRLDGPLGVLSALSAVEHLRAKRGMPRVPLEVVALRGEEGSRFPGGFIGSLAWTGRLEPELDKRDRDGIAMRQALQAAGGNPDRLPTARRGDLGAFLELHIEQGGVLEARQVPIGVVSGIVGLRWIEVRLRGQANHAGTTPMTLRRDPVLAAARMLDAVTRMVTEAGPPAVVTCGRINCRPGGQNIVAAACDFTLDLRDLEPARLERLYTQVEATCRQIAAAHDVTLEWVCTSSEQPVSCAPHIQAALRASADALGLSHVALASGAGHDAMIISQLCPVGMLFVPSIGGRSHCPEEDTHPADIHAGLSVLTGALERLAY